MTFKFTTSAFRSALMQKIRSKETKPEIALKKALRKEKIKYRCYNKLLPGNPDIELFEKKIIIFIDGEFWHGFNWKLKKERIKAHRKYWIPKIEKTIKRDRNNNLQLRKLGWTVLRFWEHEIKKDIEKCIRKIKLA